MDVSVVVVTVNCRRDVERNISELRAQTGVRLELVAVDNGSSDGTEEFLAVQPDVRLIANRANRWLSPAWAQGVRASGAPYVLFLTPDVSLPQRDALQRLAHALEGDPGAALAGPRLFDEQGGDLVNGSFDFPSIRWIVVSALGLTRFFGRDSYPEPKAASAGPVAVKFVNGACMLARRSALERIGGLDERYQLYYEEIDLARRLQAARYRILLVPDVHAVHRGKGVPAPRGLRERAYAHGERLYFRKHHGRAGELAVRAAREVEGGRRAVRRRAGR